jgi:hypothetical protein
VSSHLSLLPCVPQLCSLCSFSRFVQSPPRQQQSASRAQDFSAEIFRPSVKSFLPAFHMPNLLSAPSASGRRS